MNNIERPPHTFHYLKVEVITPLHIGSGRQLVNGHDFVSIGEKDKSLLIPDLQALAEELMAQPKEWQAWEQDCLAQTQPKDNFLSQYFRRHSAPHRLALRSLPVEKKVEEAPFTFKEYIHLPDGRAYLPGSSLKGALRTQWIVHQWSRNQKWQPIRLSDDSPWKDETLVFKVTGGSRKSFSPNVMRMVRVGDGIFGKASTECAEMKVHNLLGYPGNGANWSHDGGRKKANMNHAVEVVKVGSITAIRMDWAGMMPALAEAARKANHKRNYKHAESHASSKKFSPIQLPAHPGAWEDLVKVIQQRQLGRIKQEIAFWDKYGFLKKAPADLILCWENLLEMAEQMPSESVMLQLGAGGGLPNMTGDWQWDLLGNSDLDALEAKLGRIDKNPFPKTRRSIQNQPPGWVKLTSISEADYYDLLARNEA